MPHSRRCIGIDGVSGFRNFDVAAIDFGDEPEGFGRDTGVGYLGPDVDRAARLTLKGCICARLDRALDVEPCCATTVAEGSAGDDVVVIPHVVSGSVEQDPCAGRALLGIEDTGDFDGLEPSVGG